MMKSREMGKAKHRPGKEGVPRGEERNSKEADVDVFYL